MRGQKGRSLATGATLAITNLTKLAGLVIAVDQAFGVHPRTTLIALAAFMMAGAQFSESVLINAIGRVLGSSHAPDEKETK